MKIAVMTHSYKPKNKHPYSIVKIARPFRYDLLPQRVVKIRSRVSAPKKNLPTTLFLCHGEVHDSSFDEFRASTHPTCWR